MPHYKLVYFDLKARAEVSRLLFAQAGVDYEDIRIPMGQLSDEVRAKYKAPFGQLPLLDVDGEILCQSHAIEKYIAKQHGLVGSSPMEEARCDMIIGCIDDMGAPLFAVFREKDEAKKGEIIKKYGEEQLTSYLTKLENILIQNKGGDGFIIGDQVTVADITVINAFELPPVFGVEVPLDKFPKLKALNEKVRNLPNIKAWIDKRPKSQF